ncbi:MAG: nucleotidyltransferase domain-containing protein [Anaerolineae bacterium]|nr:nucleotidyltransferase domain-containing protein [Anaerolineae bacterium]
MSRKITNHEVLARYRDALLARFPDQLQRLILFGSQARGDATAESDIDVLVVANWESERRFHEWSPLTNRGKEEGIEIWRHEP